MTKLSMAGIAAAAFVATATATYADERPAPRWIEVAPFATLPENVRFPEGISADPATGDIYVATLDFGPNPNKLMRFDRTGHLEAIRDFGAQFLLGLGFANDRVYILNFGASKVQRIAASFDANTAPEDVATVPQIGAPLPRSVGNPDGSSDTITFGSNSFASPNAMVFDRAGNLYFSDSFQGAIFRIDNATTCAAPCAVTLVSHDPLLATAGFPPFGANGLALDTDESTLFIANTGDSRILKMDIATSVVSVFAESVHGADGLLFEGGRLWAAANQGDEVVALNASGRVVMRAGEFDGIRHDGSPKGLLFPASLARAGDFIYVTNVALPLTGAVGDEVEEDVTRWNVVRFRIPRH